MSTSKQEWQDATLSRVTQRFPERREDFATDSGLNLDTVYTPEDDGAGDYHDAIGYPGEFPYTRGVQPNMYRGRIWTMRQYAGYATAAATNERYRYLLENGQTGLSVAFDLPTQIGYDSDHPLAEGEVGKVGVPICSLADMETLFNGIPLDRVSTSMTINATAAVLLCLYIAAGKKQGVSAGAIERHPPKRHPQGVHRPGHLRLPAAPVNAAGGGRVQVLLRKRPPLEHHQHQRLPYA